MILAIDISERRIVIRGWSKTVEHEFQKVISELGGLPLGGLFVTAVHREGLMQGTDMTAIEAVRRASSRALTAAGGITTHEEIDALDRLGVDAVVGMALYTGRLTLRSSH